MKLSSRAGKGTLRREAKSRPEGPRSMDLCNHSLDGLFPNLADHLGYVYGGAGWGVEMHSLC